MTCEVLMCAADLDLTLSLRACQEGHGKALGRPFWLFLL